MDSLPEILVFSDYGNKTVNCYVYDLKTGSVLTTFKGGNSIRHGLSFIGQDYIISALKDQASLRVWALTNTSDECENILVPGTVSCLAVTNCGSYCIVGIDKSIYVWEVVSGVPLACIRYHTKNVTCLRVSSDGSHFLSGSLDGLVLVWLLADAVDSSVSSEDVRPRFTWMDHSAAVTDIYIGGIGVYARAATASKDMTCRLYELETGFLLLTVCVDYAVTAVTMDELEYFLILGSAEGDIHRINLFSSGDAELHYSKADTKCAFVGHKKEILSLSISLSGKYLVSGSEDHECKIWDMSNFSCVRIHSCKGPVTNVFTAVLPPGLNSEMRFCPKTCINNFKRQFDRKEAEAPVVTRIEQKKLSLFHLGSPDEYFSPRVLSNSTVSSESLIQNNITVKDVTNINAQMYAFALNDTFGELYTSDSQDEDEDED